MMDAKRRLRLWWNMLLWKLHIGERYRWYKAWADTHEHDP